MAPEETQRTKVVQSPTLACLKTTVGFSLLPPRYGFVGRTIQSRTTAVNMAAGPRVHLLSTTLSNHADNDYAHDMASAGYAHL